MYLVIDVGGTFIKHCVMDRDAEIMEKNNSLHLEDLGMDWRTYNRGWMHSLMHFSRYMMDIRKDMIYKE